jgi:hypothetical protein
MKIGGGPAMISKIPAVIFSVVAAALVSVAAGCDSGASTCPSCRIPSLPGPNSYAPGDRGGAIGGDVFGGVIVIGDRS